MRLGVKYSYQDKKPTLNDLNKTIKSDFIQFYLQTLVGERASVVRHSDNLKMEGSFEGLKSEMHEAHKATRGERATVTRRQDNLKMEGSMQFESTSKSAGSAINKVNFARTNRSRDVQSSIVIGEDTASTVKAIQLKEQERAVTSSGASAALSTVDKSAIRQQMTSDGVASTVVQSKSQEATISALNTDKFASSLRESSGVQVKSF